jgi:hypothetical protein
MTIPERCNDNGGYGIGAGHECLCMRNKNHSTTDYGGRSHGCSCGALWRSKND